MTDLQNTATAGAPPASAGAKPQKKKGTAATVLGLLKPHRGTLTMSILFATVNTVMQLMLPAYTSNLQKEIIKYNMDGIVHYSLVMLGFTLIGIATAISNTYFSTKTSVGYSITLRNYIFDKVSHLSQSDVDKIGVASLATRTTNDVRQIHDIVLSTLKSLIPIPIMLVGGLVLAFHMNPQVAKISLWVIPIIAALAIAVVLIILPLYNKVQKLVDRLNQSMREKISGIRVIRAFNRMRFEDERFASTNKELTGLSLRASRILAGLMPFLTVLMYSLICIIAYISIIHANELDPVLDADTISGTIPNLSAFIAYFSMIITSLLSVTSIIASIPRASVSGRRIRQIMDAEPDVVEAAHPVEPREEDRGTVEFVHVGFRYKPAPEPDEGKKKKRKKKEKPKEPKTPFGLEDISFVSRPGETTAIIGVTGSGKTTLMNLIPRLYDATEGEVWLSGVNIKDLSFAELQNSIAFVPQQAFLFSGTVADNLRFGNENATDAELWRALEIAQAKTFVAELPDGLDSFVSQAGKNYSGGQKQRLAIARAIVKNARILLLDDSFSALDLATDARLRAAMREELRDTNIILVAQRVGTVLNADRIIVLENGRTVGIGTHRELLKTCETYREIVATQLSEDALKEADGDA